METGRSKEVVLKTVALERLMEDLDKAASIIDLVRLQIEASANADDDSTVTTPFQRATMLEMVDGVLLGRREWVNDVLQTT